MKSSPQRGEAHGRLVGLWSLKELFRFFWHETDAVGGRAFCDSWYAWSNRSRLDPVRKVVRVLTTRLDRILMWFAAPISNEVAEGGNTGLKARRTVGSAARSGVFTCILPLVRVLQKM